MVQWVSTLSSLRSVMRLSRAITPATFQITFVVLPLMALELGTAALLTLQGYNPFNSTLWYLSLAVLAGIWLSTMLWQVPLHNKLASGFMLSAWRGLVQGNWLRTVGWSIRTAIVFYLIWNQLRVHQA